MKRMPFPGAVFALLLLNVVSARADKQKEQSADGKAIDALVENWVAAHDKGDAQALGKLYAADADFVGIDGTVIKGRDVIVALYTNVFAQLQGNKAKVSLTSRRWLAPNIVIDDGTWKVLGVLPKGAPTSGRYTTVFRKQNGQWQILCGRTMVPATQTALDR